MPGCPPDADRIWAAVSALLAGEPVVLEPGNAQVWIRHESRG